METNGNAIELPAILVGWDNDSQLVHLKFDTKQFKSWDFVLAVLEMAKSRAQDEKKKAQMEAMRHQVLHAAQAEAIKKSLRH